MLKSYEAIYDRGQLRWLKDKPDVETAQVIVTVVQSPVLKPKASPEEIQKILDESRGAWGVGKSIEEIDEEIAEMRREWNREWNREWDDPNWKPGE